MAFKLSKKQETERNGYVTGLTEASNALNDAIREFNEMMAEHREKVANAADLYNEMVGHVNEFITNVAETAREEWEEKSERWQEGDAGKAADSWIQAWERSFGEYELETPNDMEEFDASDDPITLEELPDSPE